MLHESSTSESTSHIDTYTSIESSVLTFHSRCWKNDLLDIMALLRRRLRPPRVRRHFSFFFPPCRDFVPCTQKVERFTFVLQHVLLNQGIGQFLFEHAERRSERIPLDPAVATIPGVQQGLELPWV